MLLMAWFANHPIAVAPAIGHNFFFAFSVVLAMDVPWQVALGAVAGLLFILVAGIGLRERLITAIPASLKHAIAVGIGLLIAMVGLQWAGVIVDSPGTLVTLGNLRTPLTLVALFGLVVMARLFVQWVRAAPRIGILTTALPPGCLGLWSFKASWTLRPRSYQPFFNWTSWEPFDRR